MYKILPTELYNNFLQQFETHVFQIVMRDVGMIDNSKTTMFVHYNMATRLYTFDVTLQQGGPPILFNVYEKGWTGLYDKYQSAIYVWKAAMHLSRYKDPIDQHAIQLLNIILPMKKKEFISMQPSLFYKNLVYYASKNEDLKILARAESFEHGLQCQIRPIYDPSCHSLMIQYRGESIKHQFDINEKTYDCLQYQCLAIVDGIANLNQLSIEAMRQVVESTQFVDLYYMNRLKPLKKSRLFACKISRLMRPGKEDVALAAELFDQVYDEYAVFYEDDMNAEELIQNSCEKTLENMFNDLLMLQPLISSS
jgi:hypothetical protein